MILVILLPRTQTYENTRERESERGAKDRERESRDTEDGHILFLEIPLTVETVTYSGSLV
jgi:hypothetical protein